MANAFTTTYNLTKPEVGASEDSWGGHLNANSDAIDDLLDGTTGITPNLLSGWEVGGTAVTATAAEFNVLDGITATVAELNILDGVTASAAELNLIDGVTATTAELNILDGVTATAAELNILDGVTASAAELNLMNGVTATTAELNLLDGVTATTAELNYMDGVTSAIQAQLNAGGVITASDVAGTEGYVTLGNGMIFQWGYKSGTGGTSAVSYSVAFQSRVFFATAQLCENARNYQSTTVARNYATSLSGVTFYNDGEQFVWFALGI
jgi:hypothetical protein